MIKRIIDFITGADIKRKLSSNSNDSSFRHIRGNLKQGEKYILFGWEFMYLYSNMRKDVFLDTCDNKIVTLHYDQTDKAIQEAQ